jgi:hypothetical protein
MNRAIAHLLAIPRSFTPDQIRRPFIVAKLVPDSSNAAAQHAVLAQMTGSAAALWGSRTPEKITSQIETTDVCQEHEEYACGQLIAESTNNTKNHDQQNKREENSNYQRDEATSTQANQQPVPYRDSDSGCSESESSSHIRDRMKSLYASVIAAGHTKEAWVQWYRDQCRGKEINSIEYGEMSAIEALAIHHFQL